MLPVREDGRGGGKEPPAGERLPGPAVDGRSVREKSEKSGIEEDARERPSSIAPSDGALRWNWCGREWVNGDTGDTIVGEEANITVEEDSGVNTGENTVLTEIGEAAKSSMRSMA